MSTLNINSNRYLNWLDNLETAAPYPYSPIEWKEAWDDVYKNYRQIYRQIKKSATVDLFEDWLLAEKKLETLNFWLSFCGEFSPSLDEELDKAISKMVAKQLDKVYSNRFELRPVLTALCKKRNISEPTRDRINAVKNGLVRYTKDILDKTEPKIAQKEERFLSNHPGLNLPSEYFLRGLKRSEINVSWESARAKGLEGVLIERSGLVIKKALTECENRHVREAVWKMHQESTLKNDVASKKLFDARQIMAANHGFSSFAHHELSGRMQSNPKSLVRSFEKNLTHAAHLFNQADDFLSEFAQNNFNIEKVEDWDKSYLTHEYSRQKYQDFPVEYFPWIPTLKKVVPELLAITGWFVISSDVIGEKECLMMHWEIERKGEKNHIWVAPFQSSKVKDLNIDGDADYVRVGPNKTFHGCIHLFENSKSKGIDLVKLEALAHEVGHLMHWLSIPPSASDKVTPRDLTEIPSVLLEHYPRDPSVLKRWSCVNRPLSFWKKQASRDDLSHMRTAFLHNLSAWLDLNVNTTPPESLEALVLTVSEKFGITAPHPSNKTWMGYAMWLGYGASDYMYYLAYSVVHRLHPEIGANPKAERIAKEFKKLEKAVLSRSHLTPQVVHNSWKNLTGETLLQSLNKGGKTQFNSWSKKLKQMKV